MKNKVILSAIALCTWIAGSCQSGAKTENSTKNKSKDTMTQTDPTKLDTAVLAGGCFWCLDAVFRRLHGVQDVISGYANGNGAKPTYEEVCTGRTGYAEAVQIIYDTTKTNYSEILEVYWRMVDPTTMNSQGNDHGTQYRSGIYWENDSQKDIATKSKEAAEEAKLWDGKFVTEMMPLKNFFVAEDYHQDYFKNNPDNSYCVYVVGEKVEKFKKLFKAKMK